MNQYMTIVCQRCHIDYRVWHNPADVFICPSCNRKLQEMLGDVLLRTAGKPVAERIGRNG